MARLKMEFGEKEEALIEKAVGVQMDKMGNQERKEQQVAI